MLRQQEHPLFTGLLIIQTLGLIVYPIITLQQDGMNFLARAQEFVLSMAWMGQFA